MPRLPLLAIGPLAEPTSCQDGAGYCVENPPPEAFHAGSLSNPVIPPTALSERTGAVPPTAITSGEAAGNCGAGAPAQPPRVVPPLSPEAPSSVMPRAAALAKAIE